jgi:hypothetical protein
MRSDIRGSKLTTYDLSISKYNTTSGTYPATIFPC